MRGSAQTVDILNWCPRGVEPRTRDGAPLHVLTSCPFAFTGREKRLRDGRAYGNGGNRTHHGRDVNVGNVIEALPSEWARSNPIDCGGKVQGFVLRHMTYLGDHPRGVNKKISFGLFFYKIFDE